MSTTTVNHGLRRRTLAWLSIAALLAVGIVAATTTTAHADDHWDFDRVVVDAEWSPDDGFDDEVPYFFYDFVVADGEECEREIVVYPYPVQDLDDPQPIDTTIVVDEVSEGFGNLTFPDLEPGWYDIQVATCVFINGEEGSESALFAEDGFGFAVLQIDKQVDGEVAEDATFVVEAACEYAGFGEPFEEFVYERGFGAEGGSADVVLYPWFDWVDIDCSVSETDDGGAESSTIDGAEYAFLGEDLYDPETDELDTDLLSHTTTVTNTFPEAEEEDDEDEAEDDEDEPEAQPAQPVEAQPDYTG